MYDLSVQLKDFEAELKQEKGDMNQRIIEAIEDIIKATHKIEMKSKAIELSKKKFSKDLQKQKIDVLSSQEKKKETQETIKKLVSDMNQLKKLQDEIVQERETYSRELKIKADEIEKSIEEKVTFQDKELEDLLKENERMKNDMQNLYNFYHQKRDEHIQKCKNLQVQYQAKQEEQSQKLNSIQSQVNDFKTLEEQTKKKEQENQLLKLKINEFPKRFEEYLKMSEQKQKQYENYSSLVNENVNEMYQVWRKDQEQEELEKKLNPFFLELMLEVSTLEAKLKSEQE